jgi:hypothetical protein
MTDGGVSLLSQTEDVALEIKTFDAHDGQGLTLAHIAGLRMVCITGRQSSALLHEMKLRLYRVRLETEFCSQVGTTRESKLFLNEFCPDTLISS